MRQGYSHGLACGVIAASGTLGILIPPSIMLIIMADLLQVSVGNVFMAAIVPGLTLATFYLLFVWLISWLKPSVAPPLPPDLLNVPREELIRPFRWDKDVLIAGAATLGMAFVWWFGVDVVIDLGFSFHLTPPISLAIAVLLAVVLIFLYAGSLTRSAFLPPVLLISMIKGSILFGWATPSEAGAVGGLRRHRARDDGRSAQLPGAAGRVPHGGAHGGDDFLHHPQRHLLRLRLPFAGRR